jgi:YegS/Rv2252/BmrU family lipid kinase
MYMDQPERRSFTVLWNASSGWDEKTEAAETVREILSAEGRTVDMRRVERGVDLCGESGQIAGSDTDVLVAAGGDGTLNAAASALIHQPTALGVLPAGTLNHFARDLDIPLELSEAARLLVSGRVVPVDAASVNGRVFINNAVLGLFPNYRAIKDAWERRGFGRTRVGRWIAMLAGMLGVVWRLPSVHVRFQVEGETRQFRTPFVLVGNNEHQMEGFALGRRSSLNEGRLWVYIMRPRSRWKLLGMIVGLLLGRAPRESVFEIYQASQLTIESRRRRVGIGVDGEIVKMTPPLEFRSLPGSLRVIVPPSYQARLESAQR